SDLTLEPGRRTEAAGPFFYSQEKESQKLWAVPPFFSYNHDLGTDSEELEILYPVLTYIRYGQQYRWHFFQLLSSAGGPTQQEPYNDRFTLFPLYFRQFSTESNKNYTAFFPIYGHLQNRLFRDDIFFVMFPFYSETRKRDVIT